MIDQKRGCPCVGDLPEPLAEVVALARVEAGRRLVEAEQPRLHGDRPCHADELPLTLPQLGRHRVRDTAEVEQLERLVGRRIPTGESADEALELLDFGGIADAMPAELTQGQRKLVGVARAIAMRPRLLCLDEPAAGLDTRESDDLGQRLRQIADAGTTTLLIDHDMGLVLNICDRIVVLEFGKVIAAGPPDDVRRDARVVKAYLGSGAAGQEAEAIATDRDEAGAGRT